MLNKGSYKYIWWLAVIILMGTIFFFSSQPAYQSDELSKRVSRLILRLAERFSQIDIQISREVLVDQFNSLVRKYAHGLVYFLLAVLTAKALALNGAKGVRLFFLTLLICICYAIIDEFHQSFVPGRGAQLADIFIDSAGVAIGNLVYFTGKIIGKKTKN
ncbi:MAG: VanZ family protein [Peptococcaceae bacterium]|nr:VanZ family protein [Peptococcaceae bacterium]